jgi:tight adherence protein C
VPVLSPHPASEAIPLAALAGVPAAVVLAGAAGCVAAFAIAGLADALTARRTRRTRPATPARRLLRRALRTAAGGFGARAPAPLSLHARLDAAGASPPLTTADVMAAKLALAATGALAALPAASAAPGRLGVAVVAALPVAGFLAPDAVLRRRAARRAARIELELPDVADLLRVAVEAGLPPTRALAEVGRRHPGVLAAELRAAAARTALGVAHDEALDRLVRRAPVAGVRQLVAALRRAHRHGAPLHDVLAAIAADARAERARRLRDRAARAAPKIQLVVALLLVPAVLLLVAAGLATHLTG